MSEKPSYEELAEQVRVLKRQIKKDKRDQLLFQDVLHFKTFFEEAPYGFILIDLNGNILFASKKAAERLGRTITEIEGTRLKTYFPRDIAEKRKLSGIRALTTGKQQKHEDQIGNKWYYSKIIPIKDRLGKYSLLAIYSDDITDRKRLELKLKKERQKLNQQKNRLQELNSALKVILEHSNTEMIKAEKKMIIKLKKFIYPYIERIEHNGIDVKNKTYVEIMKKNLINMFFSPQKHQLPEYLSLTPTEVEVADLVGEGKNHKDIARLLNVSPHTALYHMKNIRKKLGLSHKKINLRSYLQSFAK